MVPGGFETLGFGLWALGFGFGLRAEQLCVGWGRAQRSGGCPKGTTSMCTSPVAWQPLGDDSGANHPGAHEFCACRSFHR